MPRDALVYQGMTTRDAHDDESDAVNATGDGDAFIGRVIAGNFRIDQLIGSGAMGNVYSAEQISLGKRVAVKVLQPQFARDDRVVQRFRREAKSASRLDHPNSVQMIDTGEDGDGTLYIAMELLEGRDLSQVLRDEGALPLHRVRRITAQVLSALEEAHAKGVVHRDLKPSNIMLIERRTERDFVKVCDFGIAKAQLDEPGRDASMLTIQGNVCGTPEYMAPEQARGEPLDGRADLYAIAVIVYQMVTGQIPFAATSPFATVSMHLTEPPVPPSVRRPDLLVPPALDNLILRALAKRREDRPQTAAEFRELLELAIVARPSNAGSSGSGVAPLASRTMAGMPSMSPASHVAAASRPTGPRNAPSVTPEPPPTVEARRAPRQGHTGRVIALSAVAGAALVLVTFFALRGGRSTSPASSSVPSGPSRAPERAEPPSVPGPMAVASAAATMDPPSSPPPVPADRPTTEPSHPAARPPTAPRRHPANHVRRTSTPAKPTVVAATVGNTLPVQQPVEPAKPAAPVSHDERPAVTDGLTEADRLLAQGEVSDACRRGEDARRAAPGNPAVYKFLGKCYMRAGRFAQAKDHYRRYLELAPTAPDAPFIKSMLK